MTYRCISPPALDNGCVLILYPDTNAFHPDLLMLKRQSKKLLEGLLPGRVEVALSPVVLAEAQRQARLAGQQTVDEMRASMHAIERRHGVQTAAGDAAIAALLEEVARVSEGALSPLVRHPACRVLPWPVVDSEELVMRELEELPPTRVKGGQSVGLRDTIIWHGLVELARSLDDSDVLLFVTADEGFLGDDVLASPLARELEDNDIDPALVQVAKRLESAVVTVEQRRDLITHREGAVRQAIIDHLASFHGAMWAQIDPDRSAPLRYGVEEGLVSAVDSINIIESWETPDIEGGSAPSVRVEATAEVTVSGYMRTDEYIQEYSDVVDWMHGEIDEPMIGVDFTATIHLEAEVLLTDRVDDAWVDVRTLRWID